MTARRERGFLVIAAVFLIVVLAALAGYLMTTSTTSQAASAADQNSARAYQAARAGVEWALYHVLQNPPGGTFKAACDAAPAKGNLTFGTITATVRCSSSTYAEGGVPNLRRYSIVSTACNAPSPDCGNTTTASSTYIEREVSVSVTDQ
jgi:MSHA biogenesis protein MshP